MAVQRRAWPIRGGGLGSDCLFEGYHPYNLVILVPCDGLVRFRTPKGLLDSPVHSHALGGI